MLKTVLITGAAGDIGRATALKFAKEGWNILGHYNTAPDERIREITESVKEFRRECNFIKANFLSQSDFQEFLNAIHDVEIHSLINNAGGYSGQRHFSGLTVDNLVDTFTVNVFAPILLSANIFEQMKERKYGRILQISSVAAKYGGSANSMDYGCSKRALEGMTRTLAREGAGHGILVNTIRAGVIDTQAHKKYPKDMKARTELIPLKRLGTPEDIASMAFYLASDENQFVTNETVTVSGGE